MFQARILEWVASPFSRGSSQPRDWNSACCFLNWPLKWRFSTTEPPGKPKLASTASLSQYIPQRTYWVYPFSLMLHTLTFCLLFSFLGEGNGTPLQYSCLENPMDRGAWWDTVHGVVRVGHDWATSPSPSFSSLYTFVSPLSERKGGKNP